jgi:hypothetical protein
MDDASFVVTLLADGKKCNGLKHKNLDSCQNWNESRIIIKENQKSQKKHQIRQKKI